MATVTWDTWHDDVLPYANGCPPNIATMKIRDAAIEFFRRSKAWRYLALTAIDSVQNQQTYVLGNGAAAGTVPADTVVTHVYQAIYNGLTLTVRTPSDFKALAPDCWFKEVGCPDSLTQFLESQVSLYRVPESLIVGAIVLPDVALAPSQASAGIDSTMYERWRDVIAKGALSRLYRIPKKPYTNTQEGYAMEQEFIAACGSASARVDSGRGAARIRTQTIFR